MRLKHRQDVRRYGIRAVVEQRLHVVELADYDGVYGPEIDRDEELREVAAASVVAVAAPAFGLRDVLEGPAVRRLEEGERHVRVELKIVRMERDVVHAREAEGAGGAGADPDHHGIADRDADEADPGKAA